MSLSEFHLPKEKGPWLIGGAVALALVFSGMFRKSQPAPDGSMLTPGDLLAAIRATSSDFAGAATAGASVGGSIATAGIGAGADLGRGALDLAGRTVEAQSRVTETAVGSVSRGLDSTLALLGKLADSSRRTLTPAPLPDAPQPFIPPPAQPIAPIGGGRGFGPDSPPPPAIPVRYQGYDPATVGPRTAGPSALEQNVAASAQRANLGALRGPTTYKLNTGEWITIG